MGSDCVSAQFFALMPKTRDYAVIFWIFAITALIILTHLLNTTPRLKLEGLVQARFPQVWQEPHLTGYSRVKDNFVCLIAVSAA